MSESRFNPIPWISRIEPLRLAVSPHPPGGADLAHWLAQARDEGVDVLVSALQKTEQTAFGLEEQGHLCRQAGIEYINFPVRDHDVPKDMAAVEDLAQRLFGELTRSRGVLVHCYAGIGRSVLIASCTLAVAGVRPGRAFELIGEARGLTVPDTQEQEQWIQRFVEYINRPRDEEV